MPSYDFECPECGHRFEEFLPISERNREDIDCPACGHEGARRTVSAANLSRRGGGSAPIPPPT